MKMKLIPATVMLVFATVFLLLLGSNASVSASSTTTNHHQRLPFVRGKVKAHASSSQRGWYSTHLVLSEENRYTQQLDVLLHWQQQQRRRKQQRQQQRSLALRQILRRHPASGGSNCEANEIQ